MTFTPTLSLYVARGFLGATLATLAALTGLVALFDFIELLRRAATRPEVGFDIPATIAALRLPFVALQILPFAILLGGIIAFWRLTRSSELIVARAAGVSAWGFLAGPLLVAVALGTAATAGLSPLSSMLLARAERIEFTKLRTGSGMTTLAGVRLWLRQSERGIEPQGVAIISGRPVAARAGDPRRAAPRFELHGVTVWRMSEADRPLARIEAPRALLAPGRWVLEDAVVFGADLVPGRPWVHRSITMGYDRFPELLVDEKTRLLDDLAKRNGRLFFTHDPECAMARITKDELGRFGSAHDKRALRGELA